MLLATAGAFLYTASPGFADEAERYRPAGSTERQDGLDAGQEGMQINEPAGASRADARSQIRGNLVKSQELLRMEVKDQQQQKLGQVKDLVIDLRSGAAPIAVVSTNGFLGVGERLIAVPVTAFQLQPQQDALFLRVTPQQLASAPAFERQQWPQLTETWVQEVHTQFGVQPRQGLAPRTETEFRREIREPAGADRFEGGQFPSSIDTDAQADYNLRRLQVGRPEAEMRERALRERPGPILYPRYRGESPVVVDPAGAPPTSSTEVRVTEQTRIEQRPVIGGQQQATVEGAQHFIRASELNGMSVRNAQGDNLGTLREVVVDIETGHIAYGVLSAGGFLGIGDRRVAVPITQFTAAPQQRHLVADLRREQLRTAPQFDEGRWEQMTDRTYVTEVYQFYGEQPYWGVAASPGFREPAGAAPGVDPLRIERNQWQQDPQFREPSEVQRDEIRYEGQQIREPSGAQQPSLQPGIQRQQQQPGVQQQDQDEEEQNRLRNERQNLQPSGAQPGARIEYRDNGLQDSNQLRVHGQVQQPANQPPQQRVQPQPQPSRAQQEQQQQQLRSQTRTVATTEQPMVDLQMARGSDLRGMRVNDAQGQSIGNVRDVIVDLQTGSVAYVLIGRGGFMGVGENHFVAPITLLKPTRDEGALVFQKDASQLKPAAAFDENRWEQAARREFITDVYRHYGEQPYWQRTDRGTIREPAGGEQSGAAQPGAAPSVRVEVEEPAGAEIKPIVDLQVARVSDLTGMNLRDQRGEDIGNIRDVVIDLQSGHVAYVVVSRGGFLGVGANYFAVPVTLLRATPDEKAFVFTREVRDLKPLAAFDEGKWEQAARREVVTEIYTHYGEQPYWGMARQPGIREPAGAEIEPQGQDRDELRRDQQRDLDVSPEAESSR